MLPSGKATLFSAKNPMNAKLPVFVVLSVLLTASSWAQAQQEFALVKIAPDIETASQIRTQRELERRYTRPQPSIITSEKIPVFSGIIDGVNDLSRNIAKYRYGEPVSFLGKERGIMVINQDLMITPPHRPHAPTVLRYGLVPLKSPFLPSKAAFGIRFNSY